MLVELRVRDLGVIEDLSVDLGPGMTALTGETGAGKTLVVEALELLLGGRADPVLVRPGAPEALVEGRFVSGGGEILLARAVAAKGRSRAWVDGRMAPVSALAEAGSQLVDLHGQHGQQSLLDHGAQRRALDAFAGIDLGALQELRARSRLLEAELASLGGDERARAREVDLLRYQLEEIEGASLRGADEDEELAEEEARLSEAAGHREAAARALASLDDDRGAVDLLGQAEAELSGRSALVVLARRLHALQAEASDAASDLRAVVEGWEDDPERLAALQQRRQQLRELSRKYGEGVAGVIAYAEQAGERLAELESVEERASVLGAELETLALDIAREEARVGGARRTAAGALATAVEARLRKLSMPKARLVVEVGEEDPGDDVDFLLGANPGEPVLPLAKVASGGELARTMLALRLVLSDAPPTMVFDEVDAGIGGEAALSVGRALAELAAHHQVVVVTHLPQVAAFASAQHALRKDVVGSRTISTVHALGGHERVVELARMLSGTPESATARRHAEELLEAAGAEALHR